MQDKKKTPYPPRFIWFNLRHQQNNLAQRRAREIMHDFPTQKYFGVNPLFSSWMISRAQGLPRPLSITPHQLLKRYS